MVNCQYQEWTWFSFTGLISLIAGTCVERRAGNDSRLSSTASCTALSSFVTERLSRTCSETGALAGCFEAAESLLLPCGVIIHMRPTARANRLNCSSDDCGLCFCCQSSVHNGLAFPISVTPYVRTGHDCFRSEHLDIAWSDNGGFLAVLMIIPFRGKRQLIVVTNIVSSNRTWTTTLSLEKSSRNMLILNRLHCMNLLRFIATHMNGQCFTISPYKVVLLVRM